MKAQSKKVLPGFGLSLGYTRFVSQPAGADSFGDFVFQVVGVGMGTFLESHISTTRCRVLQVDVRHLTRGGQFKPCFWAFSGLGFGAL